MVLLAVTIITLACILRARRSRRCVYNVNPAYGQNHPHIYEEVGPLLAMDAAHVDNTENRYEVIPAAGSHGYERDSPDPPQDERYVAAEQSGEGAGDSEGLLDRAE